MISRIQSNIIICIDLYDIKHSYVIKIVCIVIWYKVFVSNTNNLHRFIYQAFLFNTINFPIVVWF